MPVAHLLPRLVGFVVLTIAGERLELARIAMGANAGRDLIVLCGALAGAVAGRIHWPGAYPVLGLTLLLLVGCLAVHDVTRHTPRSTGLSRFSAACLLAGYGWLGVTGALWMVGGTADDGTRYDVVVHATY